jgi:hypothetical protein
MASTPASSGSVVHAADFTAGRGQQAGRLVRRFGPPGFRLPPYAAFDPDDPASVTRRSPDSDEIASVVLRSEAGPPSVSISVYRRIRECLKRSVHLKILSGTDGNTGTAVFLLRPG